eukprot:snap_masked-scaffold289_size220122-processed-gene-1.0 protein:Tk01615 transcript:snap_masked-scaffold289_size220122-processed-gene-1.0-mRNA-1 annotation:"tropomodulin"
MSRMVMIGSTRDPKPDPLQELDIDELVERLTPGEIQRLLDECDPDDPHIPPSMRTNYKCEKTATGPLDRKKLMDYINDEALNTPDIPDAVPFVAGTVRGKKWQAPPKQESTKLEEKIELDIDLGEEYEVALSSASTDEIVDLAGILGLHSMMNQDQFHSAQSDKWAKRADPTIGWNGITKATPLKEFPVEEPNRTKPEEVISKLKSGDDDMAMVNLNNVPMGEQTLLDLFDALRHSEVLIDLSLANCMIPDFVAANLATALESNKTLEKLNVESNNITPQTLVKIFEAANVQMVLQNIKASNQQAQFLGNKVEMAITTAIEKNKTLLNVGLHFEFGDCRNRVAVQLQKNLDRVRLKRVAHRLSRDESTPVSHSNGAPPPSVSSNRTGGYFGPLPGQLPERHKTPEDEYEYEEEEEDEENR